MPSALTTIFFLLITPSVRLRFLAYGFAAACVVLLPVSLGRADPPAVIHADSPKDRIFEIDPSVNWCAAIAALRPGDELALKPGDYPGPCKVRRSGEAGLPVVVRAANIKERPRIVYDGGNANALEIYANHIIIRGLEFGPTQQDIDAVRIYGGNDIAIEDCVFKRLGGIAIVANHDSVRGLVARRNTITDSSATAMYFGCHDGSECIVSNLLVEFNTIARVDAPAGQVGYGIQVKLNSSGVIRHNMIVGTKGPPIMVYGARDENRATIVEHNYVNGSRTSSGIVVGGGPAIVRFNVAKNNADAAVALEDYNRRGLLRGIVVARNAGDGNMKGALVAPQGVAYDTGVSAGNGACCNSSR